MRAYFALAAAFLAIAAFVAAEDVPDVSSEAFIPSSTYAAVSLFGGFARGPSYDAAAEITAWASEHGSPAQLEDVGRLTLGGVAFDYYPLDQLGVDLRVIHGFAPRRTVTLEYDADALPSKLERLSEGNSIVETLAYTYHNVDLKLGLQYVPFPEFVLTPYILGGAGVNSTVIRVEDQLSDPWLQKVSDGLFLSNGVRQRFTFDWAATAGVRANIWNQVFIFGEYSYDRPFNKHYVEDYKYDTGMDAVYVGAGWKFL